MRVSEIMRSERNPFEVFPIKEDVLLKLAADCEMKARGDSVAAFNLYVLNEMLGCRLSRKASTKLLDLAVSMNCPWALYAKAMQLQRETFKRGGIGSNSIVLDEVIQIIERDDLLSNAYVALVLALAYDKGHAPLTSLSFCPATPDFPSAWNIDGMSRDAHKAFSYYRQAFDFGLKWPGIMCRMAEMLEKGDGVEKDVVRACQMYLTFAPREGDDPWRDRPIPKYSFNIDYLPDDDGNYDSIHRSDHGSIRTSIWDGYRVDWCVSRCCYSKWVTCGRVEAFGGVVEDETILPYWILDMFRPMYRLPIDCEAAAERVVEMRRDGIGLPISKARDDACREYLQMGIEKVVIRGF